jgi:selenide, water dikinase
VEAATQSMLKLNREACEAMLAFDVHACTDVTGFGLIGHAREMALASKVTMEIDPRAVQFLPGALEYARQGAIPGGLKNNREFASSCVEASGEISPDFDHLLYDPQTSGGLLIALSERDAALLEMKLPDAYRIGQVTERKEKPIRLT